MNLEKPRLLIFVVAYFAESTLEAVLKRLPQGLFETYECEVLVVDDGSTDRTFEIGREYRRQHPEVPLTVLRNRVNQGYGGNQKVGYVYAIERQFDFVALLHGDGQYAPEEMERLLSPLAKGEADAVFGSRMLDRFGALRGGMPLYKFVGNKILSALQNALLSAKLSEFHSGYRVYSVAALRRLPFLMNSNDFHFDTEIIIQLLNASSRIIELPIPTYYGDEICRVNGLKYARDVMVATLKNAAHRSGLLYQRRYDPAWDGPAQYDLKLGYASSHTYALAAVPAHARVLDLGAGPGHLARELVAKGCSVTAVEQPSPGVAKLRQRRDEAPASGIRFVQHDLNAPLSFDVHGHDYLLLLDVIEHLHDPEQFLEQLRTHFDHQPKTLVLTTPNIGFAVQRLMLLLGQFNYGKAGILDRTHTRLFTFRSLLQLLTDAGLKTKVVRGVPAPFPKVLGNNWLGRALVQANLALIRLSKPLFSYQIYIEAETTPTVAFLLRDSTSHARACDASEAPPRPLAAIP